MCRIEAEGSIVNLGVEKLNAMRQSDQPFAVLDVREDWEREICAFEGSLNISLTKLAESIPLLPTDRPLVVMCHHGVRSLQAVHWLRLQGFENAVNLDGGIDAWARQIDQRVRVY